MRPSSASRFHWRENAVSGPNASVSQQVCAAPAMKSSTVASSHWSRSCSRRVSRSAMMYWPQSEQRRL